jgi:hypothetical protein
LADKSLDCQALHPRPGIVPEHYAGRPGHSLVLCHPGQNLRKFQPSYDYARHVNIERGKCCYGRIEIVSKPDIDIADLPF